MKSAKSLDKYIGTNTLVAHRGFQAKYPENTVLSLIKAIELGALYIELDIQFSLDKLPIIYHDDTLERVSGVTGSVFEQNRDDLLTLSAFEPGRLGETFLDQTIAPLEDLVDILHDHPQVTAFVELKAESIAHCGRELMISQVQRILSSVAKQTVLMSFDYELANIAHKASWPSIGVVLERWSDLDSLAVKTAAPDYIFADHQIIPEDHKILHSPAHQDTILVAYEVGNKALAQSLLDRNVDMLETYQLENLLTES
ncbi:MAG: glycerophosphodiester phosphodiesterase family protein [Porticoccaceae bacterium]|nr:glycerophosphodiester phosphodiesterase family protein [Porticoccaceae bacterium]MDG1475004.1 glycerophosphodiester phosphodiesterase family protein [Porticoccaceae bacterium]